MRANLRSGWAALLAAVLVLGAAGEAAGATAFVFHAKETEGPAGAASFLFGEPLAVASVDPAVPSGELARAIFDALAAGRPTLYAGSSLTAAGGGEVTVDLADAALRAKDIVVSELYWSLTFAGFTTIRAPRLGDRPLAAVDAVLPVLRPVYALWQVLPPAPAPVAGIVWVDGTWYDGVEDVRRRVEAGNEKLLERLRTLLLSGPEPARLAIVRFYEARDVAGRAATYLSLLNPGEPQALKLALLEALAKQSSQRVLDAMAALADNDTDPVVKSAAARYLMDAGREKYRAFLALEKLQSEDTREVLAAVQDLIASKDSRVSGALASLLGHGEESVRVAALEGLVGLQAWDLLAEALDDPALPVDLRLRGATLLEGAGDVAHVETALRFRLRSGAAPEAAQAAEGLGARGMQGAVPDLVAALKHADAGVRHAAARALGALKSAQALPALAEAAGSAADKDVVEPEIVRIVEAQPLDRVIELTSSDVLALRKLSLKGLAAFAKEGDKVPPRILTVLRERLKDSDQEIRRAAVFALARTGDAGVAADLMALHDDSDAEIRVQVLTAARTAKPAGAGELATQKLKDPADPVKLEAVRAVRDLGVHAALQQLLWMVDYGNADVKREVLRSVVALAQPADHEKLFDIYVRLLFDLDQDVKLSAIEGMRVIQDTRVVSQLSSLVRDPEPVVQVAALHALGTCKDPRAVEPVAGALMVGSKDVKLAALDALGALGVEQARKPVQEFLTQESDMDLRTKAEQVLDLLP